MDLATIYQQALAHHRAGELAEAERLYRDILAEAPDSPDVLSLLASILDDTHRPGEAAEAYRRMTSFKPDDPEAFIGLGNCLRQLAELDYVTSSKAASTALAENYVGLPID